MKRNGFAALLVLVLGMSMVFSGCTPKKEEIVNIGAMDYIEQFILGHVMEILINENTDIKTKMTNNLSNTVLFTAFTTGNIDLYVEYTGTIYGSFFGLTEIKTPDEVYEITKEGMKTKHDVRMLERIGFNNTYALAVRPDTAEKYHLRTISDLARVAPELTLGATIEFVNREDGLLGIQRVYDIQFKNAIPLQGALRYTALMNDEIQVTSAFSTDGMLMRYELVVLEDDMNFFPPYHAVVVIREETAKKYPKLVEEMNKLAGALDDDIMRQLNYRVDVLQEESRDVAKDFLRSSGLIR